MRRALGIGLLVLLAVHPFLRPEGGWALLSTCDVAAFATAIGLLAGWHRWIAAAFVFQLVVGLPAMILGMLTTYQANISGIAVHVLPLVIGGVFVYRDGMPRWSAMIAWFMQVSTLVLAAAIAPPALNINLATVVWPPLARSFSLFQFQLVLTAAIGVALVLCELGVRALVLDRRERART
ncbi:MAG: hypothetical protein H0T42_19465 [Deltaproteobacteria bacterium]|nr:hypothetical protein [Deltaproteobacteria bacterium]